MRRHERVGSTWLVLLGFLENLQKICNGGAQHLTNLALYLKRNQSPIEQVWIWCYPPLENLSLSLKSATSFNIFLFSFSVDMLQFIHSTAVFNAMISQLFLTLLPFLQKDCENVQYSPTIQEKVCVITSCDHNIFLTTTVTTIRNIAFLLSKKRCIINHSS